MQIRRADENDIDEISELIADFRVTLAGFRGMNGERNLDSARKEFMEYMEKGYPVYIAMEDSKIVGYLVCSRGRSYGRNPSMCFLNTGEKA